MNSFLGFWAEEEVGWGGGDEGGKDLPYDPFVPT